MPPVFGKEIAQTERAVGRHLFLMMPVQRCALGGYVSRSEYGDMRLQSAASEAHLLLEEMFCLGPAWF